MTVVTAFHPGDADQALRLADWTRELGGAKGHDLILIRDATCDPVISEQIRASFAASFDSVQTLEFVDHFKKWPESPNAIFSMVARHIRQNPRPWLFCEPDCVPLKPGWLDLLCSEYQEALAAGKTFMGDFVSVHTPELDVPDHMSGNAIYPGDMMKHAGVALIANDIAWDVLAAGEILPQMHRSKLIHHSWKHGAFADWEQFEREVLAFKPDCCLFHADKSGSLYPLLRERRNNLQSANEIPTKAGALDVASEGVPEANSIGVSLDGVKIETQTATTPAPSMSLFIKSWEGDREWLHYCLRSIEKFASGFSEVVLVLPNGMEFVNPLCKRWLIHEPEDEDSYLRQQKEKLYADTLTDASHFLFLDSDTIFIRPVTPETYFRDGKILWLMTPWEKTNTPWRPIVEKFMGQPVEFEFMRRHPTVVPRWLLAAVREFCLKQHGMPLDQYVMSQPHRAFSEFNALGAFAYQFHRDQFHWVNTEEVPPEEWPELTVRQEHSWGGLHEDIKTQFEKILSESTDARDMQLYSTEEAPFPVSGVIASTEPLVFRQTEQVPWESKEQSLEEIRGLAERLQKFCGKSSHVRAVRLELHNAGVIELPYRFRRRKGKWRRKVKK